ncbi:phage baseplate assembly protein V [Paraburkholderia sp. BL8N3]|nr:phage baseplate assembly protein V [Paraburkholderia sp. BL8N3]TCK39642.1 phage baseplate assembly protein V [Paraburkholderia sp. BL8N3]
MTDQTHGLMNRLARLISTAIGRARITVTNDSGNVQFVQVQVNDLETIDNLPRLAEFGFASVAPNGSDVVMVSLGGGRNNAVVIATGHQASRPKGLKPGEQMIYSQDGKSVYLTASGGIIIDAKGQDVTVNNAGTATINAETKVVVNAPVLECTGDIIDNTGTNARTMAQMRSIFNSHTHDVTNVQGGGDTRTSNSPNQTE